MIHSTKKVMIFIGIMFVVFIIVGVHLLSNSMLFLPKGENIETIISPDGLNTMNAYFIDGGTLSANSIRVEMVNNEDGIAKNIYWGYRENEVSLEWLNNEYVVVNGIILNIYKDTYRNN